MKLDELVQRIYLTVQNHYMGNGEYRRFLKQNEAQTRKMGNNEYGCADAANILYTIGAFPHTVEERAERITALQKFQNENGLFDEKTHHPIHCTAHCAATLELFDAKPLLPLTALKEYCDVKNLEQMLSDLKWVENPWPAAHEGAGIYAAFILTGNATPEWQDAYFNWITEHTDPKYGIGLAGAIDAGDRPISHHLNGWFHYMFNFVFARRPIPCADQATDTCIELFTDGTQLVKNFGRAINFAEIDWVYMLNRASKQNGHRVPEAKEQIRKFAKDYIDYLYSLDYENHDGWNDLHALFGTTCALAEIQAALPGEYPTDYPLKLVLDRRPFI